MAEPAKSDHVSTGEDNSTDQNQDPVKPHRETTIRKVMQSTKRPNYINWDEYFMAITQISAERSKDPRTQVGACIVNKNKRIVGIGYNGFSDKMEDNDDIFSWERDKKKLYDKHLRYLNLCHAEMNAIMNKSAVDLTGCKIYSTLYPCNECAKLIAQSRIEEVYYKDFPDDKREKPEYKAAKEMFEKADIKCIQLKRSRSGRTILIDLYEK